METGKIALVKLHCFPLLEPHLEGISPSAGDSGHTIAGVTLYAFRILHFSMIFLLIWVWSLICKQILFASGGCLV